MYSSCVHVSDDVALARLAAVTAGNLANEHFRHAISIRTKSAPGDVVTNADLEAEDAVCQLLVRERPNDGILGEEGTRVAGTRRWLVDAIDGTLNFVLGDPFWCSAVAVEDSEGGVAAAIYHSSSGEVFTAARGAGSWLNDQPLELGHGHALEDSVLATYLHPGDGERHSFLRVLDAVASTRIRGSGSLELAWLAAGRVDVWMQRNVNPWDFVPGALVVTEAGGVCETISGADGEWSLAAGVGQFENLRRLLRE